MTIIFDDFKLTYKEYNRCRNLKYIFEDYMPEKSIYKYLIRTRDRFAILKEGELHRMYVYGEFISAFTYDVNGKPCLYISDISNTSFYVNIKYYYEKTFSSTTFNIYEDIKSFLIHYLNNIIEEKNING